MSALSVLGGFSPPYNILPLLIEKMSLRGTAMSWNLRNGVVLLSLAFLIPAAHAAERQPVPDEAAQKEAAALVKEVFGQEIESAKTLDQKLALIKKLLEEASRSDTSSDSRYALLHAALDNAPDASAALSAVNAMAKHFQIDSLKDKASTIWQFSKKARTSSQHKAVVDAALQLVDESVKRDAYDTAMKLAEIALNAAQKAMDWKLVRTIRTRALEVRQNKAAFDKVRKAVAVLEKDPTDAEANLTVGTYKCFVKGDWDGGVPMLALGGDNEFKSLAIRELKTPTTSNEQVALGDDWYDLAKKSDEAIMERILQRAGFWYQLSLKSAPALSRLVKLKVESRMAQVKVGETAKQTPKTEKRRVLLRKEFRVSAKTSVYAGRPKLSRAANTGIFVRKGQEVRIVASGQWVIRPKEGPKLHFVKVAIGQVGQTLIYGCYVPGEVTSFTVPGDGYLFLGTSEVRTGDNSGSVTVRLEIRE